MDGWREGGKGYACRLVSYHTGSAHECPRGLLLVGRESTSVAKREDEVLRAEKRRHACYIGVS